MKRLKMKLSADVIKEKQSIERRQVLNETLQRKLLEPMAPVFMVLDQDKENSLIYYAIKSFDPKTK